MKKGISNQWEENNFNILFLKTIQTSLTPFSLSTIHLYHLKMFLHSESRFFLSECSTVASTEKTNTKNRRGLIVKVYWDFPPTLIFSDVVNVRQMIICYCTTRWSALYAPGERCHWPQGLTNPWAWKRHISIGLMLRPHP